MIDCSEFITEGAGNQSQKKTALRHLSNPSELLE
jgi:hypothetical protein